MALIEAEIARVERIFLHQLMEKKLMLKVAAVTMFDSLKDKFQINLEFQQFIRQLNETLNAYDFTIKNGTDQLGRPIYCLINTNSDEIALQATKYTPSEITYFKSLVF